MTVFYQYCLALLTTVICLVQTVDVVTKIRSSDYENIDRISEQHNPWLRRYKFSMACERTKLVLNCPQGKTVSVVRAIYGRSESSRCPDNSNQEYEQNTNCNGPIDRTTGIVKRYCDNRNSCEIPVINQLFGDPCPRTYKYLEVYHACVV